MLSLLPHDALTGVCVGISVSESPDLSRLGLLERHLHLALAEVTRCVLVAGGTLAYGGHLEPSGYTAFLAKEVARYGRRDQPLLVCLASTVHRGLGKAKIDKAKRSLGLLGDIVCLDDDGNVVEPKVRISKTPSDGSSQRALTSLRAFMGARTNARVLIGGKTSEFEGRTSGLIEEALIAVQRRQPVFIAGGFGGAALAMTRALRVSDGAWSQDFDRARNSDPKLCAGLADLSAIADAPGWSGVSNGLDEIENRQLACTHRPSEIAAFVALGLGRLKANGKLITGGAK